MKRRVIAVIICAVFANKCRLPEAQDPSKKSAPVTEATEKAPSKIKTVENIQDYYNAETKTLDLRSQNITSIDASVFERAPFASEITKLILSNNNLDSLPDTLAKFTELIELKIDHNKLKKFPDIFKELKSLQILDISHNNLTSISDTIGYAENLTELYINNNKLACIPYSINFLKKLEILQAKDNNVEFDYDFNKKN
jgi:Leucine-rich repeat (LRR) protein